MMKVTKSSLFAKMLLVFALAQVPVASATVTYQVGDCLGSAVKNYAAITAALAATPD